MYKLSGHHVYFKPLEDEWLIKRVWICTVYDEKKRMFARGVSILSVEDTADDAIGRELSYYQACRALKWRNPSFIVHDGAWNAIRQLKARDLAYFTQFYPQEYNDAGHIARAYVTDWDMLTHEEQERFERVSRDTNDCLYADDRLLEALKQLERPVDELSPMEKAMRDAEAIHSGSWRKVDVKFPRTCHCTNGEPCT